MIIFILDRGLGNHITAIFKDNIFHMCSLILVQSELKGSYLEAVFAKKTHCFTHRV